MNLSRVSLLAVGLSLVLSTTVFAQSADSPAPQPFNQVISANPFGLLIGLFNAARSAEDRRASPR